jgi:hypothetical protein
MVEGLWNEIRGGRNMPSKTKSLVPSEDQVRQRAYEIYLARGCEHGRDLEDWLEAERQLSGSGEQRAPRSRSAVAGRTD